MESGNRSRFGLTQGQQEFIGRLWGSHRIIKKAEWLAFGKIKTTTTGAALGSREQGLVGYLFRKFDWSSSTT